MNKDITTKGFFSSQNSSMLSKELKISDIQLNKVLLNSYKEFSNLIKTLPNSLDSKISNILISNGYTKDNLKVNIGKDSFINFAKRNTLNKKNIPNYTAIMSTNILRYINKDGNKNDVLDKVESIINSFQGISSKEDKNKAIAKNKYFIYGFKPSSNLFEVWINFYLNNQGIKMESLTLANTSDISTEGFFSKLFGLDKEETKPNKVQELANKLGTSEDVILKGITDSYKTYLTVIKQIVPKLENTLRPFAKSSISKAFQKIQTQEEYINNTIQYINTNYSLSSNRMFNISSFDLLDFEIKEDPTGRYEDFIKIQEVINRLQGLANFDDDDKYYKALDKWIKTNRYEIRQDSEGRNVFISADIYMPY